MTDTAHAARVLLVAVRRHVTCSGCGAAYSDMTDREVVAHAARHRYDIPSRAERQQ